METVSSIKNPRNPASEDLFSTDSAVRYLRGTIARQTLAKRRCEGRPPEFLKIGRKVFYRRSALDAFLNSCERRSTSDTSPRVA